VQNSSNITISTNQVSYAGRPVSGSTHAGIYMTGTTSSLICANVAFKNTDAGIYLNGSTGVEIRGNTTYANARQYIRAAPGIDVNASSGNTVDRNISYRNEDTGIQVYNGSSNTLAYDNLSYGNGDHGIDTLNSPNATYIANTVYNNHTAGINVEGAVGTAASSGATVRNNISVDNGLTSTTTKGDIRVDASSVAGSTIDSDLLWLHSAGTLVTWGSTRYTSLSLLHAATGQETRGIQARPAFVKPAAGDFRLTEGSRAIDSADSGAPDQPSTDLAGNSRTDDPATPNTGIGPRSYDDRGALEYQPPPGPTAALTVSPPSAPPRRG
jgi:parallel beta-helix repeat protein